MATAKRYAEGTTVTATRSLAQIKAAVNRYGAKGFMHVESEDACVIQFLLTSSDGSPRQIRYALWFPPIEEFSKVTVTVANQHSSRTSTRAVADPASRREKEINRLWRALADGIEGKLVLVQSGIEVMEQAFFANIVRETGRTHFEETQMQIASEYRDGKVKLLLPAAPR